MRALVFGGAGSGKSAFAEELSRRLADGGRLIYLATMSAGEPESRARIARHRAQRAGKGFETVERPCDLAGLDVPAGCTVLLEDLGNLAANELFLQGKASEKALQDMLAGIARLEAQARHLVVVGNAVFSDGGRYDGGTMGYLRTLARLQNALAGRFEQVTEVVCGLPVYWKGEGL